MSYINTHGATPKPFVELPKRLWAALAPLLLAGCGSSPPAPTHYQLVLDPNLPAEARLAVLSASGAWEVATPQLTFKSSLGSILGPGAGILVVEAQSDPCADDEVCVFARTIPLDMEFDRCRVELELGRMAARGGSVVQAAEHEIGHGMRLQHDVPGTLMAAYVRDQAPVPTDEDVSRWLAR